MKIKVSSLADFWGVTYSSFYRTYVVQKDEKHEKQLNAIKLAYVCYENNIENAEELDKILKKVKNFLEGVN